MAMRERFKIDCRLKRDRSHVTSGRLLKAFWIASDGDSPLSNITEVVPLATCHLPQAQRALAVCVSTPLPPPPAAVAGRAVSGRGELSVCVLC